MKNHLIKYEEWFLSKHAMWHVHTNLTDGALSVEDIFCFAEEQGIRFIFFAEHIRKNRTYDLVALIDDVFSLSNQFGIEAHVGVEARILPDATLDISQEDLGLVEAVYIAEHSLPRFTQEEYIKLLLDVFNNQQGHVWAHPGLYAKKRKWRISFEDQQKIIDSLKRNSILPEYNRRYNLPFMHHFGRLLLKKPTKYIYGMDFHTIEDFRQT